MARKLRVQYLGAICHVMNRGDQREAVFRDDKDRQKLLATLGEACRKTERPAAAPFLPRRAICNLENLPGVKELPFALEDASWGAQGSNFGAVYRPRGTGGCDAKASRALEASCASRGPAVAASRQACPRAETRLQILVCQPIP